MYFPFFSIMFAPINRESIFFNPNPRDKASNCTDVNDAEECNSQQIGSVKCIIIQGYILSASDHDSCDVFYDCDNELSIIAKGTSERRPACSVADPMQGCAILRIKPFLSKDVIPEDGDKTCDEENRQTPDMVYNEAWEYLTDDSDSDDEVSSKTEDISNQVQLKHGVPLSKIIKTVHFNVRDKVADNAQLTFDTEMYAWGDNRFNCLGHLLDEVKTLGEKSSRSREVPWPYISEPQIVPFDAMPRTERVQSIACSPYHTLVLTSSGAVYSCGEGSDGQLGHGHTFSCQSLQLIEWFIAGLSHRKNTIQSHITQISAGADEVRSHSAAIDSSGAIYTWGRASICGHIGYGPKLNDSFEKRRSTAKAEDNVLTPKRIESFRSYKVLKVSCGGSFTIAIATRKKRKGRSIDTHKQTSIYSWGLIAGGRLGNGQPNVETDTSLLGTQKKKTPTFLPRPTLISGLEHCQITDVSTGSAHALALSAEGEVYAWGRNHEGQCCALPVDPSLSNKERNRYPPSIWDDVWIPRKVYTFGEDTSENAVACFISAGGSQSAVLDTDGKVWIWGGGYHNSGSLGQEVKQTERTLMSGYLIPPKWSKPRVVESLRATNVVKLSLGDNHGAVVTITGQIYFWDDSLLPMKVLKDVQCTDNTDKAIANYTFQSRCIPRQPDWKWLQPLDGKNITDVVCAGKHTFVLTRGNSISIYLEKLFMESIDFPPGKMGLGLYSDSDADVENHYKKLKYDTGIDCVVVVAGRRIHCHKVILAHRSVVLKNMIELEERTEDRSNTVEILLLDISYDVVRSIVHFLYTDQVYLQDVSTSVKTLNLLDGAKKLGLTRLVAICKETLSAFKESSMPQDKNDYGDIMTNIGQFTILTEMGEMLKDDCYADVHLVVEKNIIPCHRCILMSRSYFRSLLARLHPAWKDLDMGGPKRVINIELPGNYHAILRIILFVYSGVLASRNEKDLQEDMANAQWYSLWDLKEQCESALEVTRDNVYDLLILSSKCDAKRLKCEALQYLSENIVLCLSKKEDKEKWHIIQHDYPQLLDDLFEQLKQCEGALAVIPRDRLDRTNAYLEELQLRKKARKDHLAKQMMGGDTKDILLSLQRAVMMFLLTWAYIMLQNFLVISKSPIVPVINVAFLGLCLYGSIQTLNG
mmetsp:Transcript_36694/g.53646  ORF Transcript_36694/g.53646 Transcript_36694/m.53646 type:complete len:1150 (-) Transcript_36694:377-3826(-)